MFYFLLWIAIQVQFSLVFHRGSAEQVVIKAGSMNRWFKKAWQMGGAGQLWTNPKRSVNTYTSVCGKGTDNFLATTYLSLNDATVIHVDIDAKVRQCNPAPCDNYFLEVYQYQTDRKPSLPDSSEQEKNKSISFFEKHFVYNISNKTAPRALNRRENQTFTFLNEGKKGVTFGFRSRGACGRIYSIKVYYNYCKATFISGIRFTETFSPAYDAKEVIAYCAENSSLSNNVTSLKVYCQSDGRWKIRNDTKCFCNTGYEPNSLVGCSPCRIDWYKRSNSSNENCSLCPSNNMATRDRSGCKCKNGYYKLDQSNIGECYALPKYTLQLDVKQEPSEHAINITWKVPKLESNESNRHGMLKYDVTCSLCLQQNSFCNDSCGQVKYTPSQHNLTRPFVRVSNLKLGCQYLFRVYPTNRLNNLVDRTKWNYTQTRCVMSTQTGAEKKHMEDEGFWPYIYVVAAACAVLFSTVIILVIVIFKRRANFKRGLVIRNPNQVELPSVGRRLYIDPTIYDSPENALNEFASELERSAVVLDMLIGGGEFGDVYKGQVSRDDGSVVAVAVKTLKRDANERSVKDFLLEASIMAQFKDPNVIRLEGVVTKSTPRMIVTEFMSNGSLDHFLQTNDNRLPQFQLIGMARGVASGMKYLSGMNFVHRDLAARNILVNERCFCKISDFGLSRALETEGTSRGEYSTTGGKIPIRWTAPEAIHYRKFSSASDVWSYGILLWEIMSFADRPYGEWDNFRVMREVEEGYRLCAPEGCPKAVHDLMLRCWNCVRFERPTFEVILFTIDEWITSPEMLRGAHESSMSNILSDWLQSIKMGSYAWHLIAAGYRTPSQLQNLRDNDLKEMGITLIGHRNKILKGVKAMQSRKSSSDSAERSRLSSVAI